MFGQYGSFDFVWAKLNSRLPTFLFLPCQRAQFDLDLAVAFRLELSSARYLEQLLMLSVLGSKDSLSCISIEVRLKRREYDLLPL